MAYFTAVMAREDSGWAPREVDVDGCDSLRALVEALREVAPDEPSVLLLIEHEDEWFGLVRLDVDDDPRVFVSDLAAAARSAYADMLELDPDAAVAVVGTGACYGDLEVVADLGTPADDLLELTGADAPTPADALAVIAERAGFADVLDEQR